MKRLAGVNARIARMASLRAVASEEVKAGDASDVKGTPDARRRAASGSLPAGGCTSSMPVEQPAAFNSMA